jgi:protein SCO1/2
VGDKEDEAESLNHSGMLALVDKEGNVRCRFDKNGMPILYYSGLNYEDAEGKNAKLDGKFQPDRKLLIEDIKKLLEE